MRTFDELTAIARGAVEAVAMAGADLMVIVVITEKIDPAAQALARFVCESNAQDGPAIVNVFHNVIRTYELLS